MEIEEEHELERRAASVRVEEMSQRLSAAEADRLQHQMATLRLEDQLQASQEQAAELASELESERSAQRVQLDRINDLCRELIATRFELARAQKGAADAPRGEEALLEAAAQLDLRAADLILNPACESGRRRPTRRAPTTGRTRRRARPRLRAPPAPAPPPGRDGWLGAALGAALHAACVASAMRRRPRAAATARRRAPSSAPPRRARRRGARPGGRECAARGGARRRRRRRMLLERGAPPNARDEGRTPLHAAVTAGDAPMAEALLRRGADPARRRGRLDAGSVGGGVRRGGRRRRRRGRRRGCGRGTGNSGPDGGLGAARGGGGGGGLGASCSRRSATAAYRRGDYARRRSRTSTRWRSRRRRPRRATWSTSPPSTQPRAPR